MIVLVCLGYCLCVIFLFLLFDQLVWFVWFWCFAFEFYVIRKRAVIFLWFLSKWFDILSKRLTSTARKAPRKKMSLINFNVDKHPNKKQRERKKKGERSHGNQRKDSRLKHLRLGFVILFCVFGVFGKFFFCVWL